MVSPIMPLEPQNDDVEALPAMPGAEWDGADVVSRVDAEIALSEVVGDGPGVDADDEAEPQRPARAVPNPMAPISYVTVTATSPSSEKAGRLRELVRNEGRTIEESARELGIDVMVANMWLRLPEDFWSGTARESTPSVPISSKPISGIMRVLSCRVPAPAYEKLRAGEGVVPVVNRAHNALMTGLQQISGGMALPLVEARWRGFTRPLALTVDGETYVRLRDIAAEAFDDDMRDAAGFLIARGIGVSVANPTNPARRMPAEIELPRPLAKVTAPVADVVTNLVGVQTEETVVAATTEEIATPPVPSVVRKERVVEAIRSRSTPRALLPPEDSAPWGDELRRRRELVKISQRDLAAASGLSRGLVAEVERGRRRHVMTRARIADTLSAVAAEKGIDLMIETPSVAV